MNIFKNATNYSLTTLLCITASSAFADFNFKGEGTLSYPTGITKPLNFGFAWNEKEQKFTIGKKSYSMEQVPDSYSIALAINKNEKTVWIQEFTKGFFEQFDWTIGGHRIQLKKEQFKNNVLGNYVLILDDNQYFFTSRAASLNIHFNNSGIKSISIDGVTKDFGTKK
ncbi:hypothetical protein [Pseudoalteromonas denitrificans]|uniref:Secreted protein n=1 Tax=Pseudoalteromonas denitrificans DSM 6059 TaxID=1123010 RepID=A0A1I1QQH6_9GAMM|nr:hypothetical protein [Pseudoalteromonas denitrificans]SFD24376.1 hypothetical protein SAMN02745724_03972 [Pseudoalteromonas denitrificans DSM 6059]